MINRNVWVRLNLAAAALLITVVTSPAAFAGPPAW